MTRPDFTPDNITRTMLGPDDIMVFGSNTAGVHGSGAAKFARMYYGAQLGIGEGLMKNSYAFPTLNADSKGGLNLCKRTDDQLLISAHLFDLCVGSHQEFTFWLTKVGCGLAGYDEEHMKTLFSWINWPNLIKPKGW